MCIRDSKYTFRAISIEGSDCDDLLADLGYVQVRNPFTDVEFEHYFLHPDEPAVKALAL